MGGLIKSLLTLFSLIIIMIVLINTHQPSFKQSIDNVPDTNYAEEIGEKLQTSDFTKKTIVALRAAGYYPDSTIGYLIESPNNQIMTIQLHNLNKIESSTESEIQNIVNSIAKSNNLHFFIVYVQLIDI